MYLYHYICVQLLLRHICAQNYPFLCRRLTNKTNCSFVVALCVVVCGLDSSVSQSTDRLLHQLNYACNRSEPKQANRRRESEIDSVFSHKF